MTPPAAFRHLEARPVTAALGAVIAGIDLKQPIGAEVAEELRRALWDHLVLFFPEQHIDDEHQLQLASVFGRPEVHPIRKALGIDEYLSDIVDTPDSVPDRDGWHTDVTYMERPPLAAVLRARVVPESGGDTIWANMYTAYEKLSDPLKTFLETLGAFHATDRGFLDYIQRHLGAEAAERVMKAVGDGVEHPLVRTHPETQRKLLFIDKSYITRITGLSEDESRALHAFLLTRIEDPNIQCRHRWREGDVAVWDERATQHFGVADHAGSHRVLRRCSVEGERPY